MALPLSGELKQWHKLTFDFTGPESSEIATPNPFTNFRLDVAFTHIESGQSLIVPGFFAADGNAAQSSATGGNVWRVHFAPSKIGTWNYTVSFRSGSNVATSDDPLAGSSGGFFDGLTGSFVIAQSDKPLLDFRSKGRLEYVGKHHLRHASSGEYFMKAGVDSPENLLAYADFDGDFKTDGHKDELIKTWSPHVSDWQEGDPSWQDGKGKGLIGALNYLASEGLNAVSFLTLNINGDDRNVFPYTSYGERGRMDVSRLDQWEIVFEHATRRGLYLHFKTQETENEKLLDNGNTGNQRKLYYRELISRFGHHLALNWNLGEEINDATPAQKQSWASYFRNHDPYRNLIVIHNGDQHFDLMGQASELTGMSLQMNEPDFSDTFYNVRRYVRRSTEQGKPWVVACDEPGNASASLRPDSDPGSSHTDARRDALWSTFLAGGAGCEFYFGYNYPHSDLTCEDFRSRDAFWDYCRHALEFFNGNDFPFELMTSHNELISGAGTEADSGSGSSGNRCLAKIGHSYLIQLRNGGSHTLNLSQTTGTFSVNWWNPRTGGALVAGADVEGGGFVSLGAPPDSPAEDWIILVQSTGAGSVTNQPPVANAGFDASAFLTAGTVEVNLNGSVTDDGLPDEFSLTRTWSMVSGPAPMTFSDPHASITTATFPATGTYVLRLSASDSDLSHADEVTIVIQFPDTGGDVSFPAAHDAFTEAGQNNNSDRLSVQEGLKISYLMFDLSTIGSAPASAVLRLVEADDVNTGPVTIRLFGAASNAWDESTITGETAPAKDELVATFHGEITAGQMLELNLGQIVAGPANYSFILECEGDGAPSFFSSEGGTEAARPKLVATTAPNNPPTFTGFLLSTAVNTQLSIPNAWLAANAEDPDGDALHIQPGDFSSTAGGYVTIGTETLSYTPSIDFEGTDALEVSIQDGRGGSVTGTLTIEVTSSDGIEGRTPALLQSPGSPNTITFTGLPGRPYRLERSPDLVSWLTIERKSGGLDGTVEFVDTAPPESTAFYRLAFP